MLKLALQEWRRSCVALAAVHNCQAAVQMNGSEVAQEAAGLMPVQWQALREGVQFNGSMQRA